MKKLSWCELSAEQQKNILVRPTQSDRTDLFERVLDIVTIVKNNGDQAVVEFTRNFDGVQLENSQLTTAGCDAQIDLTVCNAIKMATQNIRTVCEQTLVQNKTISVCDGVQVERSIRPIETVGLYVPGGSAPLISTLLMLAVPAQVAGCENIVVCTPPNKSGKIDQNFRYAARCCGIESVYTVGGAQAIAAMAYGTQTIPKVDKIFGPGNRWVTAAKQIVANDPQGATIDMPAGPSELLIIADASANPSFVAADLLSQLEHGPDSQVLLITTNEPLASAVINIVQQAITDAPRASIIQQSMAMSSVIVVDDINTAIQISNQYAPEHLIMQCANVEQLQRQINNAGCVFLGPWASESMGDYITGSNHVLPTGGYARSVSGLSVNDFVKTISFQTVSKTALQQLGPFVETLADIEGLAAHKNAISCRLSQEMINV